jgi:hypothetical protein
MAAKKKLSNTNLLRDVIGGATAGTLIELVEQLGLVDIVMNRIKSKLEETDLDEWMEEAGDYLKRNPDVLVVGLGAITIATGVVVYLQQRKEWDGDERRGVPKPARVSTGKIKRTRTAAA